MDSIVNAFLEELDSLPEVRSRDANGTEHPTFEFVESVDRTKFLVRDRRPHGCGWISFQRSRMLEEGFKISTIVGDCLKRAFTVRKKLAQSAPFRGDPTSSNTLSWIQQLHRWSIKMHSETTIRLYDNLRDYSLRVSADHADDPDFNFGVYAAYKYSQTWYGSATWVPKWASLGKHSPSREPLKVTLSFVRDKSDHHEFTTAGAFVDAGITS